MKPSRLSVLLTAALALAPVFAAQAQRVVDGDLQQQMSAEEFKAAGRARCSRPPPPRWNRRARKAARK
jgi:hypothetical protein